MESTLHIAVLLLVGFLFGEAAGRLLLPKVSGYILAGIFLKLDLLPLVPPDFHHQAEFFTNIALAFITFSVGGSLLASKMRRLGRVVLGIALFEAGFAVIFVMMGFLGISILFPAVLPPSWVALALPGSLLLATFASPTDPATTLAVIHEYQAVGDVASSILGVAALDDAMGIIIFSVGVSVAELMVARQGLSIVSTFLLPVGEIVGGIVIGVLVGWGFNQMIRRLPQIGKGTVVVVALGSMSLCFSLAHMLHTDELLASMAMGCVVANFNPQQHALFQILEDYVEELVFVLFFTLSGMYFQLSALTSAYPFILVFVVFRCLGKLGGASLGARLSGASTAVRRFTGLGLLPQGGIVIGLALLVKANPAFSEIASLFMSIVIGATVVHELLGPISVKIGLQRAGEVRLSRMRTAREGAPHVGAGESPATSGDFFFMDLLHNHTVRELKERLGSAATIYEDMTLHQFKSLFLTTAQDYFPVVNRQGRFVGIFSLDDVRSLLWETDADELILVKDIATRDVIFTTPEESLSTVFFKFAQKNLGSIPVLEGEEQDRFLGMLRHKDVLDFYRQKVRELYEAREGSEPVPETGGSS
jgi:NhaP-type Na+/H+ or K+/H+ antiporter/CBS domain-containing protein